MTQKNVIQTPEVQEMKLKEDMRETFGLTYFRSLKRERKCTGAGRIQRKAHLKWARGTPERDTMIIRAEDFAR